VIRVGTSGWGYPHWRETYYPKGLPASRWLAHYARDFASVEINNSFYRLPPAATFRAWREQAPPDFVFAVKASRYLTHFRKLKDPREPLDRFLDAARALGPQLGPILFQLPPHWSLDLDRLAAFVRVLPRDLRFVMEFRDPSWFRDETRELLDRVGVGCCMHDLEGRPWPRWVTGSFAYVRFHGPTERKYAGSYATSALRTWSDRLLDVASGGRDVYAYFNNDMEGHALANARELASLLVRREQARAG
jgi:uncharacterized protein YecE (DUF72 family)